MANDMIAYFNAERQKALDAARKIADDADAAGAEMTPEQDQEAKALLEEADKYRRKAEDQRAKDELRAATKSMGGNLTGLEQGMDDDAGAPKRTIGEAFVSSPVFRALQSKMKDGSIGERWTTDAVEVSEAAWLMSRIKANANPVLESGMDDAAGDVFSDPATGTGPGILSTLLELVRPPVTQQPVIADLFTSIPVSTGNAVTYPVATRSSLTAASGDIPYVHASGDIPGSTAEGTTKKAVSYDMATATKILFKLTAYIKASEELIEDAPGMAAFINSDLPLQIRQAEDQYLSGELYGATTQTSTGANVAADPNSFDAILDAQNQVALAGFSANAMIVYPTDWAILRALKGGTSSGYLGGGPFTTTNNPWGLRVVVTPAAVSGTAIVGDFAQGGKVYRKGGLRMDSTNTDQDDFVKDLVTIRAFQRQVLGVTYANAFCEVTITPGS